MKNSQILIIGGSGFIGKCLVKSLSAKGFMNVLPVSRSSHGVDVCDKKSLLSYISKADYVINLAGLIAFYKRDRAQLIRVNHEGALNVLSLCESNKNVKRLIHVSSTASLGFGSEVIDENSSFPWNKHKYLGYSYSKFLPNEFIDESPLKTNILYPSLIIGPNDDAATSRLFSYVRGKKRVFVPSGSNAVTDVRDFCEAIVTVLLKAKNKENYIVAGKNVSYVELFSSVAKVLGQKSKILFVPALFGAHLSAVFRMLEFIGFKAPFENLYLGFKKRTFSSQKIKDELGFAAKFTYEESLQDALKSLT